MSLHNNSLVTPADECHEVSHSLMVGPAVRIRNQSGILQPVYENDGYLVPDIFFPNGGPPDLDVQLNEDPGPPGETDEIWYDRDGVPWQCFWNHWTKGKLPLARRRMTYIRFMAYWHALSPQSNNGYWGSARLCNLSKFGHEKFPIRLNIIRIGLDRYTALVMEGGFEATVMPEETL